MFNFSLCFVHWMGVLSFYWNISRLYESRNYFSYIEGMIHSSCKNSISKLTYIMYFTISLTFLLDRCCFSQITFLCMDKTIISLHCEYIIISHGELEYWFCVFLVGIRNLCVEYGHSCSRVAVFYFW